MASDVTVGSDVAVTSDVAVIGDAPADIGSKDSSGPVNGPAGTPCLDLDPTAFQVGGFTKDVLLITNPLGVSMLRTSDFSIAHTFSTHRGTFVAAALSPDGARGAAIDSDGKLHLFTTANAQQFAVATPATQPTHVVFTIDGSAVLLVDATGTASLVRSADGSTLWQVTGADGATGVTDVAASPDGSAMALSTRSAITLLSTADGSVHAQLPTGGAAIAFAPDGSYLAVANGSAVTLVSATTGSPVGLPMNSGYPIHDVAVSPDGTLIAAATDFANVRVFHRSDGSVAQNLKLTAVSNPQAMTPAAAFQSVAFSADGSQVAAAEARLHVWRVSDGAVIVQPDALQTGMIWGQSLGHAAPYAAFARVGGPAQVWDYTAGSAKAVLLRVANGNQGTVALDPADDLLVDVEQFGAGADAGRLEQGTFWHVGGSAPFRTIAYPTQEQPDRAGGLVFSPDGTVMAGPGSSGQPGLLRLWSPANGGLTGSAPAFMATIGPIAWSTDGALLAVAGADHIDTSLPIPKPMDESIHFYRMPGLVPAFTLKGYTDFVSGLAFLPDGQHVVTGDDTGLVQLSAIDGSSSRVLAGSGSGSEAIAVSPKGDLVAVRGVLWDSHGHNGSISVRRTVDGVEIGHFYLYGDGNIGAMNWTPDGTSLLAGSASALHVFCVAQMAPPELAADAGAYVEAGAGD
jgi:WD40 repeat protein